MNSFKANLLRQFFQDVQGEQAIELLDTFLPTLAESLTAQERVAIFQAIIERHLGTLLEGVSREARAELLQAVLPALLRELPVEDVDLLSLFADM